MKFTAAQLDDLRARNPVSALAGEWVSLRAGSAKFGARGFTGPCPLAAATIEGAADA